jgi:hypothetical protein
MAFHQSPGQNRQPIPISLVIAAFKTLFVLAHSTRHTPVSLITAPSIAVIALTFRWYYGNRPVAKVSDARLSLGRWLSNARNPHRY